MVKNLPAARIALFFASAVLACAAICAVLVRPPPLVWAAAALTAYVALLLGGVFFLRWRVFVDAVVRGPRGCRGVALTFDDGPHPKWTPQILQLLRERGHRATFFVIGRKAEMWSDLVRKMRAEGHAVGLHSYGHDRLFALRGASSARRRDPAAPQMSPAAVSARPMNGSAAGVVAPVW